jgi:[ribosomal protein S5]-alanine N-acetyltransferase
MASDVQDRLAVGVNAELSRLYGVDPSRQGIGQVSDAERQVDRIAAEPHAWMLEANGLCIGQARLHSLDTEVRRARYAVGIFNPAYWGRGYGSESTQLVLAYAFGPLKLHRVDLRTLTYNTRAIRCFEKCGFVREGIERETIFLEGEWHSDVIMSILDHEYRALFSS